MTPPRVAPLRRFAAMAFTCAAAVSSGGAVDVPEQPFSGVFGATAGAGVTAGDDVHAADNPAAPATGRPAWSASAAGYAPFGLEDLHVAEFDLVRAGKRWGAGVGIRALFDAAGPDASRWTARLARRLPAGLRAGASLQGTLAHGRLSAPEPAVGLIWRTRPALSLGTTGFLAPDGTPRRAAFGADAGGGFGPGYRLRVSADFERRLGGGDGRFRARAATDWRFGARLRLHPALSAHAGYAARARTAALGLRFGFGDWDVFSALRRHAALGPTAVQGVRWSRANRRDDRRDDPRDDARAAP